MRVIPLRKRLVSSLQNQLLLSSPNLLFLTINLNVAGTNALRAKLLSLQATLTTLRPGLIPPLLSSSLGSLDSSLLKDHLKGTLSTIKLSTFEPENLSAILALIEEINFIPKSDKKVVDLVIPVKKLILQSGLIQSQAKTLLQLTAISKLPTLQQSRMELLALLSTPAQRITSILTRNQLSMIMALKGLEKGMQEEVKI